MSESRLKQLKRNMTFVMTYLFLSIVAFLGLMLLRSDIGPASTIAILVIIPNSVLLVIVFWTFIGKDKPEHIYENIPEELEKQNE